MDINFNVITTEPAWRIEPVLTNIFKILFAKEV